MTNKSKCVCECTCVYIYIYIHIYIYILRFFYYTKWRYMCAQSCPTLGCEESTRGQGIKRPRRVTWHAGMKTVPIPANQMRKHCILWSIRKSVENVLYSNIQKTHWSTWISKRNDVPAILFIFLKLSLYFY